MDLKEKNIAEMIAKVIEEGRTTDSVLMCKVIRDFWKHLDLADSYSAEKSYDWVIFFVPFWFRF